MTKINGTALPTTMSQNGGTINVTAGTAQISANGTWSATLTATPANVNVGGTYTVSNGTATLTNTSDNSTNTATLSNNVLTVTDNGGSATTFTFTKN